MPAVSAARGADATSALQEQLRDLRSLATRSDHVRWVTRGTDADAIDDLLSNFSVDWRSWIEQVARALVALDRPPDGRVASLADERDRAWLPGEWLAVDAAAAWVVHELRLLGEWARLRSEEVEDPAASTLCAGISDGLAAELVSVERWRGRLGPTRGRDDPVDEAGLGSFPASDPPSFWAGKDER